MCRRGLFVGVATEEQKDERGSTEKSRMKACMWALGEVWREETGFTGCLGQPTDNGPASFGVQWGLMDVKQRHTGGGGPGGLSTAGKHPP